MGDNILEEIKKTSNMSDCLNLLEDVNFQELDSETLNGILDHLNFLASQEPEDFKDNCKIKMHKKFKFLKVIGGISAVLCILSSVFSEVIIILIVTVLSLGGTIASAISMIIETIKDGAIFNEVECEKDCILSLTDNIDFILKSRNNSEVKILQSLEGPENYDGYDFDNVAKRFLETVDIVGKPDLEARLARISHLLSPLPQNLYKNYFLRLNNVADNFKKINAMLRQMYATNRDVNDILNYKVSNLEGLNKSLDDLEITLYSDLFFNDSRPFLEKMSETVNNFIKGIPTADDTLIEFCKLKKLLELLGCLPEYGRYQEDIYTIYARCFWVALKYSDDDKRKEMINLVDHEFQDVVVWHGEQVISIMENTPAVLEVKSLLAQKKQKTSFEEYLAELIFQADKLGIFGDGIRVIPRNRTA